MSVNLSCCKTLMPQKFLDTSEVSATIEQVRCKAMPKGVRAGNSREPGLGQSLFQAASDTTRGQSRALSIEEQGRLIAELRGSVRDPQADPVHRGTTDRANSFSLPFTAHQKSGLLQIKIREIKTDQLTHTQAPAIEGFKHGPVAHSNYAVRLDSVEKPNDLRFTQRVGQSLGLLRILQNLSRILFDDPLSSQISEERP